MKGPSYLNCCSHFAALGLTLQMCHRGPTVGSSCKINHTTEPQAPLTVKGIGAWPSSPHPITVIMWLGSRMGWEEFGRGHKAAQVMLATWLA